MSLSIGEVNHFAQEQFIGTFGRIFEHSPWVAERVWHRRPFASRHQLCEAMNGQVAAASMDEQLALLRAHPDLGTRAQISPESAVEQTAAGLDRLTKDEYTRLIGLNAAYRGKFGFPFLYAVKGSDKAALLQALEMRLNSSPESEFPEALAQVYRIARFRLEAIINA